MVLIDFFGELKHSVCKIDVSKNYLVMNRISIIIDEESPNIQITHYFNFFFI